MSLRDVDVSEWPTLRYAGKAVTLERGRDFICQSNDFSGGIADHPLGHPHVLTVSGLEKIVMLTDDDDMKMLLDARVSRMERERATRELFQRDPEKVRFRKDVERLRKIHREGNG